MITHRKNTLYICVTCSWHLAAFSPTNKKNRLDPAAFSFPFSSLIHFPHSQWWLYLDLCLYKVFSLSLSLCVWFVQFSLKLMSCGCALSSNSDTIAFESRLRLAALVHFLLVAFSPTEWNSRNSSSNTIISRRRKKYEAWMISSGFGGTMYAHKHTHNPTNHPRTMRLTRAIFSNGELQINWPIKWAKYMYSEERAAANVDEERIFYMLIDKLFRYDDVELCA